MEDALAQGRKFLREDSAITTDRIKKLPDSEKEFFRLGASRAIRDKLLSASDGRDAYKAIFGNEVIREKVEAAFPSKESFNKFSRDILKEKSFFETRQSVQGNSKTTERLADDANLSNDLLSGVTAFATGDLRSGIARMIGAFRNRGIKVEKLVENIINTLLNQPNANKADII